MRRILPWIERQEERRWLLSLAVIAVVVRLGWVAVMAEREPRFEENAYINHAVLLSRGEGYVDQSQSREAFWPIGYPLALAAAYRVAGTGFAIGLGLQIGIGALTCLLVYRLGRQTFGSRIARVGALMLAVYPNHVFYSSLHVTEPLFTLLLIGACAFLLWSPSHGRWRYVVAGILLGLAALTRPVIVLFPLLLPLWFFAQGWRWRRAAATSLVVFCSTLVTVSPWVLRNHRLSGRWTEITTSGGYNFWVGNHPAALGGYAYPKDFDEVLRDGARYDWHRGYRLGWESMRNAPAAAVSRGLRKMSYFIALETDGTLWNLKGFDRAPLFWVLFLLSLANAAYLLLLGTGLLGLLSPPRPPPITSLFILLSSYMLMVSIIFFGDPRYHYALVPLMLLFSSKGLLRDGPRVLTALRQRERWAQRRGLTWGMAMAILLLAMAGNLWLKHLESLHY